MNKKVFLLIAILIIAMFIFTSCFGPGYSDYSYDMGKNYKLVRSYNHNIQILPKADFSSAPSIPAKVMEIAWNSDFILAKQEGLKKQSENSSYMIPDDNVINYWILETKAQNINPIVHGPFNRDKFNEQRKTLKIPDSLELKNVENYNMR